MNTTTQANPDTLLAIGQWVHCTLYGGMDGIVYRIDGEQSPQACRDLGGVGVTGGNATLHVAFADHLSAVPESLVRRSVQWRICDDIATADEIAQRLREVKDAQAAATREEEKRTRARLERRESLTKEYGWLEALAKTSKTRHALAAANMRAELRQEFPGVKFRVTSSSYSGGSSIDVRLDLGPTVEQVKRISNKYEEGSFDGMIDLYEYDRENVWPDLFGGVKYVFESRGEPDEAIHLVCRKLCEYWGLPVPEIRLSWEWSNIHRPDERESLLMIARRILHRRDYPAGAKVVDLIQTDCTCGMVEEFFDVVVESPAPPAPTQELRDGAPNQFLRLSLLS